MATASSSDMEMARCLRRERELLQTLRLLVDALRDAPRDGAVDEHCAAAVLAALAPSSADSSQDQARAIFTPRMLAIMAELGETMQRVDAMEEETKRTQPHGPARADRPAPPAGLLSLRDLSVLQAAIEVWLCWSAFPLVPRGVLLPVERRRPTKTLAISTRVLQWGGAEVAMAQHRHAETATTLRSIAQIALQLLADARLQPILLTKYMTDVMALLIYGEVQRAFEQSIRTSFSELRNGLLQALPLRLQMASLRAALAQSAPSLPSAAEHADVDVEAWRAYRQRLGYLLSRLVLADGGVRTTIEMLLGAVDPGNTQARVQVATLIAQCPKDIDPTEYATALCVQVRSLLESTSAAATTATATATSTSTPTNELRMLRETAALLVHQVAARFPDALDTLMIAPLFRPLLLYDDTRVDATLVASESAVSDCVGITHLLLCGPPPPRALLLALTPMMRPLLHLYAVAVGSKSFLLQPLRAIMTTLIQHMPNAALLLYGAVLPVTPPLRSRLLQCNLVRAIDETSDWHPLRGFICGDNGGMELAMRSSNETEPDASDILRNAISALGELLASEALAECEVVGELFVALLVSYTRVRRPAMTSTTASEPIEPEAPELRAYAALCVPRDALSVEMTLLLLLALVDALGTSVLRSASTILRALGSVLQLYASESDGDANAQAEEEADAQDADADDDVLTVCLGVVLTIVEAGASQRAAEEEELLRALLPVLEQLSACRRPQVAELASDARASILSRGAPPATNQGDSSSDKDGSFDAVMTAAQQDLASPLVPLRARGVVRLTRLVRASLAHRGAAKWTPRIEALLQVFMAQLQDAESYVYLAAVQGLAALGDAHPDIAIPRLVAALRNDAGDGNAAGFSLEQRIKLSEALLATARRCGETLPRFAAVLVRAYLHCIRPAPSTGTAMAMPPPPPLIQEVVDPADPPTRPDPVDPVDPANPANPADPDPDPEALAATTLRASCLSNLAEVGALLQWSIAPFATDVATCVLGVLQLERDVTVRRGAVFLLQHVLSALDTKAMELLESYLPALYRALRYVERTDRDEATRGHARGALAALDEISRAALLPTVEMDQQTFDVELLRKLRFVDS